MARNPKAAEPSRLSPTHVSAPSTPPTADLPRRPSVQSIRLKLRLPPRQAPDPPASTITAPLPASAPTQKRRPSSPPPTPTPTRPPHNKAQAVTFKRTGRNVFILVAARPSATYTKWLALRRVPPAQSRVPGTAAAGPTKVGSRACNEPRCSRDAGHGGLVGLCSRTAAHGPGGYRVCASCQGAAGDVAESGEEKGAVAQARALGVSAGCRALCWECGVAAVGRKLGGKTLGGGQGWADCDCLSFLGNRGCVDCWRREVIGSIAWKRDAERMAEWRGGDKDGCRCGKRLGAVDAWECVWCGGLIFANRGTTDLRDQAVEAEGMELNPEMTL